MEKEPSEVQQHQYEQFPILQMPNVKTTQNPALQCYLDFAKFSNYRPNRMSANAHASRTLPNTLLSYRCAGNDDMRNNISVTNNSDKADAMPFVYAKFV